jgi:riboflavin synthase
MFTGIITGIGHIQQVQPLGPGAQHGKRLHIQAPPQYLQDAHLGDSMALNGACMTVTTFNAEVDQFTVEVSAESLHKTCALEKPGPINLEKALRAGDRLGGHLVSGHIDGLGQVAHFAALGESWELRINAPLELAKFLAYKGSITINGVSLTINQVTDFPDACQISINLISHTVQNTTLRHLAAGQGVNLEVDQIARYCERLLQSKKVS